MDKITYENKEPIVQNPTILKKNKVTADDLNEIKEIVNNVVDQAEWFNEQNLIDSVPIGSVLMWMGSIPPEGWLILNGQAVSRTDYPKLFEIYGTSYGSGDGSTTFNLPDFRQRVAAGYDSTNANFNTLNKKAGSEAHAHTQGATGAATGNTGSTTLTINQMPSHTHDTEGGRAIGTLRLLSDTFANGRWKAPFTDNDDSYGLHDYGKLENTGGGQGHSHTLNSHTHTNPTTYSASTLQPYIVVNYIVKAKMFGKAVTVEGETDGYSTTETLTNKTWIDGSPIYRKVINLGPLPNAASKEYSWAIPDISKIVRYEIFAESLNGSLLTIPYVHPSLQYVDYWITCEGVTTTGCTIIDGTDRGGFTCYIILEYTKE